MAADALLRESAFSSIASYLYLAPTRSAQPREKGQAESAVEAHRGRNTHGARRVRRDGALFVGVPLQVIATHWHGRAAAVFAKGSSCVHDGAARQARAEHKGRS